MKARFVLYKEKVRKQFMRIKELADKVSYSVKTNFEVAKLLEEETGCDFSVHFINSVHKIKNKDRIWFFAQGWHEEDIIHLRSIGVHRFVVDNEQDVNILVAYLKNATQPIDLLLRMRLKERTIHTGKHFVYGMYAQQINEWVPKLKQNSNIKNLGIHFHRKTQNVSEWSLKEELQDALKQETIENINIVNIGGGIPVRYKNYRAEIIEYIFKKIKECKQWLNENNIRMIIEPGRFIAAPAIQLEAEIMNIYHNNIIINCSVFNADTDTFVSHLRLLVKGELEKGKAYTIKGCTPDSIDIFRYRVFLDNPKKGDTIVFLNAGAYNFATDFCKLPKLETIVK